MLKPILASMLIAGALPAAAVTFTEDFTGFTTNVESFSQGSGLGQVITDSIGASEAGVSGIDGDSIFVTFDTSNVDRTIPGGYGGGLRTTISDPISAGDLSSSSVADYNLVFDAAAVGFDPQFVTIFLNFRTEFNDNLFSQVAIDQTNASFSVFIDALAAGDAPVSVSLGLSEFGITDAQAALLVDTEQIQFTLNTRSNNAEGASDPYSPGAANILVLDNFGIEVVPEPASLALVGLGGLLIAGRRNRTA